MKPRPLQRKALKPRPQKENRTGEGAAQGEGGGEGNQGAAQGERGGEEKGAAQGEGGGEGNAGRGGSRGERSEQQRKVVL